MVEQSIAESSFAADAYYCLREAASTVKSRFAFLNELRFLLMRARHRPTARLAMERYDSTLSDSHHRVSHRVLAPGGIFRRDFEVGPLDASA